MSDINTTLTTLRREIADKREDRERLVSQTRALEREIAMLEGKIDGITETLSIVGESTVSPAGPTVWNQSRYLPVDKKNPKHTSKKVLLLLDNAGDNGMTTAELWDAIISKKKQWKEKIGESTLQTTLTRMNGREIFRESGRWKVSKGFTVKYR